MDYESQLCCVGLIDRDGVELRWRHPTTEPVHKDSAIYHRVRTRSRCSICLIDLTVITAQCDLCSFCSYIHLGGLMPFAAC